MVIKDASMSLDKILVRYSYDKTMKIIGIGKMRLIDRNIKGEHLIIDEKKCHDLLIKIWGMERISIIRYAFYLSFLITMLIGFVVYLYYLPQNTLSTNSFTIFIILFSLFSIIIESWVKLRLIKTLNIKQ